MHFFITIVFHNFFSFISLQIIFQKFSYKDIDWMAKIKVIFRKCFFLFWLTMILGSTNVTLDRWHKTSPFSFLVFFLRQCFNTNVLQGFELLAKSHQYILKVFASNMYYIAYHDWCSSKNNAICYLSKTSLITCIQFSSTTKIIKKFKFGIYVYHSQPFCVCVKMCKTVLVSFTTFSCEFKEGGDRKG